MSQDMKLEISKFSQNHSKNCSKFKIPQNDPKFLSVQWTMIISTSLENHSKDDREMLEAVVIKIVVKHLKQMLKYRQNIYKIEKKQMVTSELKNPLNKLSTRILLTKNTFTYQKIHLLTKNTLAFLVSHLLCNFKTKISHILIKIKIHYFFDKKKTFPFSYQNN